MATLFGVGNPDDAAPRLRVVRILHHRDVQLLSTGTERHVGGAISGSDREDVQQLAVGRDFQDFPAEPLGDVDIAFGVDLHAVRSQPPGTVLVRRQEIQ